MDEGFDFLLQVFNSPSHLEDVSGLNKLQEASSNAEVSFIKNFMLCSLQNIKGLFSKPVVSYFTVKLSSFSVKLIKILYGGLRA